MNYIKNRLRSGRPAYKGIKCLISLDELRDIWFRDDTCYMDKPSIHRIDSNKHYHKDNVEYIEFAEHMTYSKKRRKK